MTKKIPKMHRWYRNYLKAVGKKIQETQRAEKKVFPRSNKPKLIKIK